MKNEYCYLPGFGSLQVIKRSASFNKETLQTESSGYEVVFVKGAGSLDDSFANFIANLERISIAHASNHIREYCSHIKEEFNKGHEVIIPGIGKFISKAGGEDVYFETDPELRIQEKQIPFFKISSEVEEKKKEETLSNIIEKTTFREPKSDEEIVIKPAQVNWGKLGIIIGIIVLILAIVAFVIVNMDKGADKPLPEAAETTPEVIEQPAPPVVPADTIQPADTGRANNDAVPPAAAAAQPSPAGEIRIIVNSYSSRERAESRREKLLSYNYKNVDVVEHGTDSLKYHVILKAAVSTENVQRTVDSVKKMLNPNGNVRLLQ